MTVRLILFYAYNSQESPKKSLYNNIMHSKSIFTFTSIIDVLHHHQVIAYPTEAVFGLGCDPDSEEAVSILLSLKRRSWEKGLILIASDYKQLIPYINHSALNKAQRTAMFSTWPGPITWVIPSCPETPRFLTGCFNSLAVRISAHPVVQKLCRQYGKPLVSTSANYSKQEPCRNVNEVKKQFGAAFPVLEGKVSSYCNPSEIRDALSGEQIRKN